jgi:hypothetical protein
MTERAIAAGEEKNPLIEFGRMDDWAQLSLDVRRMRSYLRAGLTPKEALAAFRGELCVVALRTRAA